jgi:predicted dehydrogenase
MRFARRVPRYEFANHESLSGLPMSEILPALDYLPRLPVDKSVGIGCIGSGFIMADCHLVAYRQAGFNPVAIASNNPDHARQVAARHAIAKVHDNYLQLLTDPAVGVVDVAVPPDVQFEVIRAIAGRPGRIRGILAQKPLGIDFEQARAIVELCRQAGIVLCVNQNMRYDQSVRACKSLLAGGELGEPVFASIDMRAIPHWMPWQQRLGWVTLRIMSIHHLDAMRFWFGDPERVIASIRPDPRTAKKFAHADGICLYILEYASGLRAAAWDDVWAGPAREGAAADNYVRWRVEGTEGMARGTIGWPEYPRPTPSTLDYTTRRLGPQWQQPRWPEVWFPDAFAGPMADLLCALEEHREPATSGQENLGTMALVEACYRSAREHRAVELCEFEN